jgi:hypothetical protein
MTRALHLLLAPLYVVAAAVVTVILAAALVLWHCACWIRPKPEPVDERFAAHVHARGCRCVRWRTTDERCVRLTKAKVALEASTRAKLETLHARQMRRMH